MSESESVASTGEERSLREVEKRIAYRFRDLGKLEQALTHSSAIDGRGPRVSERLEFLGDSVTGLIISELLYCAYPDENEGRLSKFRAALVSTTNFARMARHCGFDLHLRLGKGEEKTGGRGKESILADVFEAVIGSVFLDGGYEAARRVVAELFESQVEDVSERATTDAKTDLQERCQEMFRETPVYRVVSEEGPDHAREFVVEAVLGENVLARGRGRSKRAAEQAAALEALAVEPVGTGDTELSDEDPHL